MRSPIGSATRCSVRSRPTEAPGMRPPADRPVRRGSRPGPGGSGDGAVRTIDRPGRVGETGSMKIVSPAEAVAGIRSGDQVYVHCAAATPEVLLDALVERAPDLHDV